MSIVTMVLACVGAVTVASQPALADHGSGYGYTWNLTGTSADIVGSWAHGTTYADEYGHYIKGKVKDTQKDGRGACVELEVYTSSFNYRFSQFYYIGGYNEVKSYQFKIYKSNWVRAVECVGNDGRGQYWGSGYYWVYAGWYA
ncbi:MAG: hypothetical protein ACRDTM_16035 [Micromonosporaceae bacterium]